MTTANLNFRDQEELIDFLLDGAPTLVADYLDQHKTSMEEFFKLVGGNILNIKDLSEALRMDENEIISAYRNFISDCVHRHGNLLPLPEQKTSNKQNANLPRKARRVGWQLATVALVTSAIAITNIVFDLEDFLPDRSSTSDSALSGEFNSDLQPNTSPSTDVEMIDDAIQEALNPSEHDYAENDGFNNYGVEGLYQDTAGNIFYYDWSVSNDVYEANVLTSQITGMPLSYSFAVQAVESSLNPNAISGRAVVGEFQESKACGLSQFVPDTLAEVAYRFGPLIGYEGIRDDLITRTREDLGTFNSDGDPNFHLHYDYTDAGGEHTMIRTCFDPHFNTRLAAVMQIREIGSLQRDLAEFAPNDMEYYPITQLQGYVAHYAGGNGGEDILRDMITNEGNSFAFESFSPVAVNNSTNQWLLFHAEHATDSDGNLRYDNEGEPIIVPNRNAPRTVAEFLELLAEEKGLSDTPLPNFTNWSQIVENIAQNIESLGIDSVSIVKSYRPAYSGRPALRPAQSG
ncbi:MAG: transglycosylase SLT domain-containing protein [Pseudomonadota bacterium]